MTRIGQLQLRFFLALVILMVGILAITFMSFGFLLNNSALVWVGSIVLATISLIAAIMEKVLLE